MKRYLQVGLILCLAGCVLVGCSTPPKQEKVAVKSLSMKPQATKETSLATLTGITKTAIPGKSGVSRVVLTLDKKASYSTSRQGNQLIINVFGAQMTSSVKQLEVSDPVIASVVTRQVGNSVKGVVELMTPDIAYTPSTSTDPFQIFLDIWPLSSGMKTAEPSERSAKTLLPEPVQKIEVSTTGSARQDGAMQTTMSQPSQQVVQKNSTMTSFSLDSQQDVPEQLQWFSEKLSEVLQEREKIKQEIVEAEKNVAVKDSMIQVLERKLKEANLRIVQLEEILIKAKSRTSLVEQNEKTMRNELQQVLSQLERASGGQEVVVELSGESEMQARSQQILSKITKLQRESLDAPKMRDQVSSLKTEIDGLIQERDNLQQQNESCRVEIDSLRAQNRSLEAMRGDLALKDRELLRLRKAIGDAAKLVMAPSETTAAIRTMAQPTAPRSTQEAIPVAVVPSAPVVPVQSGFQESSAQAAQEPGLELATLLQQNQLSTQTINPDDYVLGSGDVIQVSVQDEENLDKTVTVSPDGFITYPLLGDLRVDGLTVQQLDAQISYLLAKDFLVAPDVTVEVIKQRSKKVYIMGGVKQPGYHELPADQQLLGTLLSAGGPVSFNTEVRILRLPKQDIMGADSVDTLAPIVVDLNQLFVEGDQTQNILLQDGDVLMVASKKSAGTELPGMEALGPQQVYVVGSVVKPGIYNYKDDDTVLDAILRAGGFTEFASRNSTKVVREIDGKTKTLQVKMKDVMEDGKMDKNIPILSGDMIIVPESFF